MKLWDAHIHLDMYSQEEIPFYIKKWQKAGVEGVISAATDLKSCYTLLNLQEKYPDFVHIALGYHPEQNLPKETELIEILNLIEQEKDNVIAIGEVGIIHYRQKELGIEDLQGHKELLGIFADAAKKLDKPLVLHAVHNKAFIVYNLLQNLNISKAHFHWYKGPEKITKLIEQAGYYISLTPELTYRSRDQLIANNFNLQQILLETDGPWPYVGPYEGKIPEPLWIKNSMKELANIKGLSIENISLILAENIKKLYFS